ncbi:hypothetical protein R3P38DRAFT_2782422 [Favolaschia claudopus]|uniref:Uncharacterized protein n=1 Tax=Favolaschia claudopus TaxID=2862362 RepID=A0AAW0B1Z1_9AGAR
MPKTAKQKAAANREAAKHNKPIPYHAPALPTDLSLTADPNYQPESASEDEDDVPMAAADVGVLPVLLAPDLIFRVRVSPWDKVVPKKKEIPPELRHESEEPDSDVEMVDVLPSEVPRVSVPSEELPAFVQCSVSVDVEMSSTELETDIPIESAPSTLNDTEADFPASFVPATLPTPSPAPQVPVVTISTDSAAEIKAKHRRLRKLIKKNRTELSKKATLLTNAGAAAAILDLEALSQFNDKSQELSLKRLRLIQSLKGAARIRIPQIKQRIQSLHPNKEASLAIAHRCGKGEYYARLLRSMAVHLLEHGTLPEKQQGKGAHHESLLLNPVVHEALQEWVKGTLDVEEGGFEGRLKLPKEPLPPTKSGDSVTTPATARVNETTATQETAAKKTRGKGKKATAASCVLIVTTGSAAV